MYNSHTSNFRRSIVFHAPIYQPCLPSGSPFFMLHSPSIRQRALGTGIVVVRIGIQLCIVLHGIRGSGAGGVTWVSSIWSWGHWDELAVIIRGVSLDILKIALPWYRSVGHWSHVSSALTSVTLNTRCLGHGRTCLVCCGWTSRTSDGYSCAAGASGLRPTRDRS